MTQQPPNRGRGNDRSALKKSNLETLRGMLQKMERQLTAALPKHVTAERMIRIATTTVQRVPKLLEADPVTVVGSIMQSAQLGLEPDNVTGAAYLVPFWNSKNNRLECNLIPGYRGLMMLARRSREIQAIDARVVKRGDLFEFEYGSRQFLKHKPGGLTDIAMKRAGGKPEDAAKFEPSSTEEQPTIAAYMIAFFGKDGSQFQVMTRADLERAKQFTKSRTRDGEITGPWIEHPDAMFTKTVIRRGAKLLPFSVELQTAIALDEQHESGRPQNMGLVAADYLGVEFEPTDDTDAGGDEGSNGDTPTTEQVREIMALFDRLGLPEAKRTVLLQEYKGRPGDLIEWLRAEVAKPVGSVSTKSPADVRADRDREDAKAEPAAAVEAPDADAIFGDNKPKPAEPEPDAKPAPRASKRAARFQI